MKTYTVNGHEIKLEKHIFNGTLSQNEYETQIYSALSKIGISQKFIKIIQINQTGIKVEWEINKQTFSFTCISQENLTLNTGAIAQAIQEDTRQILRGIKDLNLVMKQYSNEDFKISKPKNLNDFSNSFEDSFQIKKKEKIDITSTNQAKRIIQDIKLKYPKFKDYSLIPEKDRDQLREAYIYLGIDVKF